MANESRPMATDIPAQQQSSPGVQSEMTPAPDSNLSQYKPAGKLTGKRAIITGGDSGIGRAVAVAYALEGADVAIIYGSAEEDGDAKETQRMVESHGRKCLPIRADIQKKGNCVEAVKESVRFLGGLDILVNNAAFQKGYEKFEDIPEEILRQTFDTNILGTFFMTQAALPHLGENTVIINTGSIVGLTGHEMLVDYSTTKGAIHTFTKALASQVAARKIRVNCVLPGPVWTPFIPQGMPSADKVKGFGEEVLMKRPGQPEELAPAYVFFASMGDSSFVTGAMLEVTGGKMSNTQ